MIFAGIVAGGTGSRMGNTSLPKQFMTINEKPIIVYSIEKFINHPDVDIVVIGINPDWMDYMMDIKQKFFADESRIIIVNGGKDRNSTIENIVSECRKHSGSFEDILLTHDAVRPFVTAKMISDNIQAAIKYGVCGTAIAATDTILYSDNGEFITDIPLRSNTYQAQTPQSFKISLFEEVYGTLSESELSAATDACKLFTSKGYKVHLVNGDVSNIKITYPYDLKIAQMLINENNNT